MNPRHRKKHGLYLSAKRKRNRGQNLLAWKNRMLKKNEGNIDDNKHQITGRRIVEISYFINSLQNLNNHGSLGCSFSDMVVISEKREGLNSGLIFRCKMCNYEEIVWTDDQVNTEIPMKMEVEDVCEVENSIIDLSSQGIAVISDSLLQNTNIVTLNLNFNDLESIPTTLCQNFKTLSFLYLNGNEITSLPNNIGQLVNLSELCLNENMLSSLPQGIGDLENLRKLHCVGNQLSTLPNSLSALSNLQELLISENAISTLPENFENLYQLEIFDVSFNKLKSLPSNFGNLYSLRNLNLANNCIMCLPESFEDLLQVENLDLSNNKISFFPGNFASSHCLKKFYINNNLLSCLPPWFEEAKNIIEISLKGNQIQDSPFPKKFGIANNMLKYLDLRGNYIVSLPEHFCMLDSLEYLDLGSVLDELERKRTLSNGNHLSELPVNFGNLKNLRELNIDENWICKLPEDFGNLSNLVSLDLNHNSLCTLPNSFCDLASLEVCMLSMNNLKELPVKFGCLIKLKDLRLDNNELCELPASFENLTELEVLDLYSNSMVEIPPSLSKLEKLRRLYLDENNFDVPKNEVCGRSHVAASYAPGNPDLKDGWRGKSRNNVLDFYSAGSSIDWQHKDSTDQPQPVIQKSFQNQAANGRPFCCDSCPKEDRYAQIIYSPGVSAQEYWDNELDDKNSHDVPFENGSAMECDTSNSLRPEVASCDSVLADVDSKSTFKEMCDTEILSNLCTEKQDSYSPDCLRQEISVYSTAAAYECWDNEVNDENFHDSFDNSERKISSEVEEDWESEAVFENPCGRKGIHVHPTSEKKSAFFFLPSDLHPESFPVNNNIPWFCADDGQFEDADS